MEENAYQLGSQKVISVILFLSYCIDEHEKTKEISGHPLSVIFEGTSRMSEALAIVIILVSEAWEITYNGQFHVRMGEHVLP